MHVLKSEQEDLPKPGRQAAKKTCGASGKGVKKEGADVPGGVVDLNHVFHDGELGYTVLDDVMAGGNQVKEEEEEEDGEDMAGTGLSDCEPAVEDTECDDQCVVNEVVELESGSDSETVDVEGLGSDLKAYSGQGEKSTKGLSDPPPAKRTKRTKFAKRAKKTDSKLVSVLDDIPDVDFEKMLEQLLTPSTQKASVKDKTAKVHYIPNEPVDSEPQCAPVNSEPQGDLGPVALILAPTRELAIQIHTHLTAVARYTDIKV